MNTQEIVRQHHEEACALGHHVFGTFLQGSQNYGLSHAGSDVDTKSLVIPTFRQVCRNSKLVSYTHVRENNEHIDLKDVRLMFQNFLKQNINMVEILFTDSYVVDAQYLQVFLALREKREQIVRYDQGRGINCCAGMAYEKYKAMKHPYPSLIDKIEKYGFDPKQLHHIVRMDYFIDDFFIQQKPFAECLKPDSYFSGPYLLSLKTEPCSLALAEEIAKRSIANIERSREEFAKRANPVDPSIPDFLDEQVEKIFRISFNIKED